YRRYQELLGALVGAEWAEWVRFDLSVVRGLAYYTGIVFELHDARGQFRAICGGGRYDNLLGAIGGTELPALGFGMGDVVLTELLRDRGLLPDFFPAIDYWVTADGEGLLPHVARVAAALRSAGASVEYALRSQSMDKQRKAARAAGATRIVTVDRTFATTGQVRLQFADPSDAQAQGGAPYGHSLPLDGLVDELVKRRQLAGKEL
ncbi:MAG: ATP phosphoribosyltransferase regulatory subunit, partial [Gemmatimonadaceae bacterium]